MQIFLANTAGLIATYFLIVTIISFVYNYSLFLSLVHNGNEAAATKVARATIHTKTLFKALFFIIVRLYFTK